MKRIGAVLTAITCVVISKLVWIWLQRHDAALQERLRTLLSTRQHEIHAGRRGGLGNRGSLPVQRASSLTYREAACSRARLRSEPRLYWRSRMIAVASKSPRRLTLMPTFIRYAP